MRDWLGRRAFPRYPVVVPVLYATKKGDPAWSGAGWTRNLSEGGACLELSEHIDPSIPLSLLLRTDQGRVSVEGQVVWNKQLEPANGTIHGVAFDRVFSDRYRALRDLLNRKGMVWRAVVRVPIELPVICYPKGQPRSLHQGRTENISRRGLCLRLHLVIPPETPLEVTLQTAHGPLTADGAIVRVEPLEAQIPGEPIRHGFRFTEIRCSTAMTLGRVLAEAI
jgi:hypothetical protein